MTGEHVLTEAVGTITVTPPALEQVVVQAAELADGVRVRRPRRRLEVEVHGGRARVELELAAPFGAVLPDVARDVQERVADALATMCGLEIEAVDVTVAELEG